MDTKLLNKVEEYITKKWLNEAPEENLYHNLTHTKEVVEDAEKIADELNIPDEDKEILLLAAWFHDIGCVDCCPGHEEIGINYAREFLSAQNYPEEKIKAIESCIKATKLPQTPKSKIEEIICDADLYHLGTDEYEEKGQLLKKEIENKGFGPFTPLEWVENNINFFKRHKYFTSVAKRDLKPAKQNNLKKLQAKRDRLAKELETTSKV